jgi:hypothetical protein
MPSRKGTSRLLGKKVDKEEYKRKVQEIGSLAG